MREAGDPSCLGQAGRSSDHHHNYAADLIIINNNFGKLGVLFRCRWNRFFPSWNERYMYQSSSIPTGRMQRPSTYLQMLMGTLGYGAYFNGAWFCSDFDFCSTHHRKLLPGTARTLALFVTDLSMNLQSGTIHAFISAGSFQNQL